MISRMRSPQYSRRLSGIHVAEMRVGGSACGLMVIEIHRLSGTLRLNGDATQLLWHWHRWRRARVTRALAEEEALKAARRLECLEAKLWNPWDRPWCPQRRLFAPFFALFFPPNTCLPCRSFFHTNSSCAHSDGTPLTKTMKANKRCASNFASAASSSVQASSLQFLAATSSEAGRPGLSAGGKTAPEDGSVTDECDAALR
mmetsp:Transcript_11179/g.19070  ORF Transcript_11179/g.19070 Transcript_11179/m.19070 type:complete len:201 (-) Transcript_11179:124-726(-)